MSDFPLSDFQKRVIVERDELEARATKLSNFIDTNPQFKMIDVDEQKRLNDQHKVMWQYFEIIEARIAAFKPESWRINMDVAWKNMGGLHGIRGTVVAVYPSNTFGIEDRDGVLRVAIGDDVFIVAGADNFRTA